MSLPSTNEQPTQAVIDELPEGQRLNLCFLLQILNVYPDSATATPDEGDNRLAEVFGKVLDKLGQNLG